MKRISLVIASVMFFLSQTQAKIQKIITDDLNMHPNLAEHKFSNPKALKALIVDQSRVRLHTKPCITDYWTHLNDLAYEGKNGRIHPISKHLNIPSHWVDPFSLTTEEKRQQIESALSISQAYNKRQLTEFSNLFSKSVVNNSRVLGPNFNRLLNVVLSNVVRLSKIENGHKQAHVPLPTNFFIQETVSAPVTVYLKTKVGHKRQLAIVP